MRRTIPQQIAANRRASFLYAFLLVLLLALMGGALTGMRAPHYWWVGATGAGVIGAIIGVVGANFGTQIVLSISRARHATPLELQRVDNVVEEMAIAAGIPKPEVYVIDDDSPNAFATGRDPRHAIVVVTTGLIRKLNREELQGVIAHEIGHVRNYDIRFMTIMAIIAGLIPLLADMIRWSAWTGGGRSRNNDNSGAIWIVVGLVLAILAPLFALLLQMAVSRQREYMADATSAELTRNPEGLINALRKIAADPDPLEVSNRATQHLYIVNPLKAYDEGSSGSAFDTHPPVSDRIKALSNLMGAYPRAVHHGPNDFSDMPPIIDPSR